MPSVQPAPRRRRLDSYHVSQLLRRAARGDRRAREEAITGCLPLARSLAARYARSGVPADDLVQVASVGLVKAADRWDPDHGASFSSFAVPTILGELRRHLRQHSWAVRPARDVQDLWLTIEQTRDALTSELGHSPTVEELSEAVGRAPEDIIEALVAGTGRQPESLTAARDDDEDRSLEARIGSTDESFRQVEDRGAVRALMSTLDARDRAIVELRFRHDLTQQEIGALLGLSQMHVSRLLRRSLEELRLAAERLPPSDQPGAADS